MLETKLKSFPKKACVIPVSATYRWDPLGEKAMPRREHNE